MWEKLVNWWHERKYEREQEAVALAELRRPGEADAPETPTETHLSQLRD